MIKKTPGFTLIELLVAMTIVAILLSISLISFQGARKTARDGRRKADLEQIRSALEIYRSDCKTYPDDGELSFGSELRGAETVCSDNSYLSVPNDALTGYTYVYNQTSANTYVLCSYMEVDQAVNYDADCGQNCGEHCYYKQTNP